MSPSRPANRIRLMPPRGESRRRPGPRRSERSPVIRGQRRFLHPEELINRCLARIGSGARDHRTGGAGRQHPGHLTEAVPFAAPSGHRRQHRGPGVQISAKIVRVLDDTITDLRWRCRWLSRALPRHHPTPERGPDHDQQQRAGHHRNPQRETLHPARSISHNRPFVRLVPISH